MDVQEAVSAIKDRALKEKVLSEVAKLVANPHASASYVLAEAIGKLKGMESAFVSKAESDGISLDKFANPEPEEKDKNCIFHGRFLEKGGAMVLVSVSGSGKSVITMQFAYPWALGRELFGIRPLRPLKIGIFQTEDSKEEIADFRASMREGFKRFNEWTDEDIQKAEESIVFHFPNGRMGDAFVAYLRETQQREHYDLVVINPLSGVTSFDLSSNKEMVDFLCGQLDPIIKHDEDTKCGLIIIHHTNKPPAANMRAGFGTDQYAQYIGAGAAKLTNWMRSMLAIVPEKEEGLFLLVAAKKGERLGWPKNPAAKSPNPTRLIRHSRPDEHVMFWQEVEGGVSTAEPAPKATIEDDAKCLADHLQAEARTLTDARQYAKDLFKRSRGDAVYEEVAKHLTKYGLVTRKAGASNKSVIGSEESVEKWFSSDAENQLREAQAKISK